jgi:hypothetical protein
MSGDPYDGQGEVRDARNTAVEGYGKHDETETAGQVPPPSPRPVAPVKQRKSRLGLFLGGGAAAAIVLYLVIAAVASTFPFAKAKPAPTPAQTQDPTTTGSLAALPAGLKPVKVLLPTDIQDASTECVQQAKIPWTNPGLVNAFECLTPDMPNGQVFGYQLDSTADYNQAWANYNKWANFGTSSTRTCPPSGSSRQAGPGEWGGPRFAQRAGQVLECFTSDSGPVYVWTYPTQNAFIIAQPDKSWTFSKLETWWEKYSV